MEPQQVATVQRYTKPKGSNPFKLPRISIVVSILLFIVGIVAFICVWKSASVIVSVFITFIIFLLLVSTLMTLYIVRQWKKEDQQVDVVALKNTPYSLMIRIFSNTALITALLLIVISVAGACIIWYNTSGADAILKFLIFAYFLASAVIGCINLYLAYLHCLDINCTWRFKPTTILVK